MLEPRDRPLILKDGQAIWIRSLPSHHQEQSRNIKLCRLSIYLPEPCLRDAMSFAALSGIYTKSGAINLNDVLGNPYVVGKVGDSQVLISATTKLALTGVAIDWGPY